MTRRKASRRPAAEPGVVNPRQPCPCGSGKRYKSCHGGGGGALVARPFDGLTSECDWIALRELVSAGSAPVTLLEPYADRDVLAVSVLPMALPSLTRDNGQILLGLQVHDSADDASADLAAVLLQALTGPDAEPTDPDAEPVGPDAASVLGGRADGTRVRLQDLVAPQPLEVTVHEDFTFWLDEAAANSPEVVASLEQANAAIVPTVRLSGVDAAYWCRIGDKAHLRWVMPHEEDVLLDALARLGAAGTLDLGEGTRFAGSFRAYGVLAPVWDLPPDVPAADWEQPAAEFATRLGAVLAAEAELTEEERRVRAGLRGRQVTLR